MALDFTGDLSQIQDGKLIRQCYRQIKKYPDLIEPYIVLARIYRALHDRQKCIEILHEAAVKFPKDEVFPTLTA